MKDKHETPILNIPTSKEVEDYVRKENLTHFQAAEFYYYYNSRGWRLKDGSPIYSWRDLCHYWETIRCKREQVQNPKSCTSHRPSRSEKMAQWLDEHLPLPVYEPAADGTPDERLTSMQRYGECYGEAHHSSFSNPAAVDQWHKRCASSLAQDTRRVPINLIYRLVMLHIGITETTCSNQSRPATPDSLYRMTRNVLCKYPDLSMAELLLALNLVEQGNFGDMFGRLTCPRLLGAFKKFIAWKRGRDRECVLG